jgi:hypothetical protein
MKKDNMKFIQHLLIIFKFHIIDFLLNALISFNIIYEWNMLFCNDKIQFKWINYHLDLGQILKLINLFSKLIIFLITSRNKWQKCLEIVNAWSSKQSVSIFNLLEKEKYFKRKTFTYFSYYFWNSFHVVSSTKNIL